MEGEMLKFLGKILAYGGGAAGVAYLIFNFLGRKTIDTWFDKRLKKFEYDLNSLFNRVSKIHEKEIEVLPIAWEKLHDLLNFIYEYLRYTNNIPNFDNISISDLEKYLLKQNFTEEEIEIVKQTEHKENWYLSILFDKAMKPCLDFQDYIDKNAIFLSSDIKKKFLRAEEIVREIGAIRHTEIEYRKPGTCEHEAVKKVRNELPPIINEIEDLVQKRLHFYEA